MSNKIHPSDNLTKCPACESTAVIESNVTEKFLYGDLREEIEVTIPVMNCAACNFKFTDFRAENIRRDAVYLHSDLLPPQQIAEIRSNLSMSRREFHEAFGIAPASMERWENGRLFQSESIDTLLRMLADPDQAKQFDRRLRKKIALQANSNVIFVDFQTRALSQAELNEARSRSKNFNLHCGR